MNAKIILITGCSSGIGKATVEHAASRGHTVLASAPAAELLDDIPDQAAAKYVIDVCDEASISHAVASAIETYGRIDVLINNAGYCQAGPVELVSAEKAQRQFAVNVLGPLAMIRHVTPHMRQAGSGCIINLSSLMGMMSLPLLGIYSASKHAVEGFNDSLRMELKDFNIDVVLVEPGFIKTNLTATAIEQSDAGWLQDDSNPYRELLASSEKKSADIGPIEGQASDVAEVLVKALESRSPKARYKVTAVGKLLPLIAKIMPAKWLDRLLMQMMT
ncbi:3-phenylpropionate-dihydrodiol/cinnamic acid-dihydrodiol dehydrogenase [Sinobacterium norvegicum]|uniref:3-phenylpropionate-dihydrodiol/cinnamic acid-dihydrodiol dehydrogenase n=1 Tax=Sinobacterium norvegicum TaxID=1641715 RepID=A0ABM9AEX3_9GAMM|nr:SDR family oxidoreductase [Sinobacterium norvegicum]CAH0991742.1 3-phenylpropionate-dihydrodiol/cinnamic acid-dihydrodiol dehydrogenase [Sinobacterium norvegicum]